LLGAAAPPIIGAGAMPYLVLFLLIFLLGLLVSCIITS